MRTSKIIKKNKDSIILLDIVIPTGVNQSRISIRGTGFIISKDGKFITCTHVYKKIPENERQYLGVKVPTKTDERGITHYKRFNVELLKIDEENDVALMKIISEGKDNFTTFQGFGDSESVKEGDEVVFLGYPLAAELLQMGFGITMNTNECIVSSVKRRGEDGSLHFFIVDTHINNGSSGSPLFSKNSGKVVGVASGKIAAKVPLAEGGRTVDVPANMGICRPAKYIVNLINK